MILLTKAKDISDLFEPLIRVKVEDVEEPKDVPLKAMIFLLDSGGKVFSSIELSSCFKDGVTSNSGTTLYQFKNPEEGNGFTFSGTASIRIGWSGIIEDTDIEISAKFDRDRGFRLLPYSATAAKISAVLSVDQPIDGGFQQIMQRTLLFGDAAEPSKGEGVLDTKDNDVEIFAFEIHESEAIDTPLPESFDIDNWRLVLTCAKYHIDGQLSGDSEIITVFDNNQLYGNSQYTVLVFYKTHAMHKAKRITEALLAAGYII